MSASNGHAPLNLRQRERLLVETYPWIEWTVPQRVVTASMTRLTCRFCTAIRGLKASELERVGGEHAR